MELARYAIACSHVCWTCGLKIGKTEADNRPMKAGQGIGETLEGRE